LNFHPSDSNKRIAVIGAGASGLVAARECLRQGFQVRVFEKSDHIGGVWKYSSDVEDDLLGQNPKQPLHGSLYESLLTNLPRKLMAFSDFPFEAEEGVSQFVSHELVQAYLEDFAKHFELYPVIEFNTPVESVKTLEQGRWHVQSSKGDEGVFDAIIVGNGHYSKPRVPSIEGIETFDGLLMHSHNYRNPEPFNGKRVAVFGAAASALDISLEINEVADQVYWCAEEHADIDVGDEIVRCGAPKKFENRNLKLGDGEVVENLDAFIFCTGYHYSFPFLEDGIVTVTDNWVHPLYYQLIPPVYPTIAFAGLPYAVIPFPLFELQVKWFTRMLAGRFELPSEEIMKYWGRQYESRLRASRPKQRNFHKMGAEQYSYMNHLAKECGADPLPEWFEPLAEEVRIKRLEDPINYRNSGLIIS
jgi:hypothetical protein